MNYPKVQLGEVCDLIYGDGLKEQARQGGAVPVYGSNGVVGYHNKALTTGETIVIGRKGSIGEVHICRVPCWPIDTTYYIENTKIPCDFTWLYYILIALDLTRFNKSAAVPGLNRDDAYEQFIPLPPLDEQRRIAAILQRADRIRRLRRLSRQLSDTFLQSVFLQMFGDPATNPRKLPVVEIQDVTQSLDSKRIPVEASIRRIRKGEYPYYGASGIIDYIDNYLFEEETLLVAEDGANLLTRSTPIAFIVSGKYWVNNHAHVLRVLGGVNIQYLRYTLNATDLKSIVTGTAQPKLTAGNLSALKIMRPAICDQDAFAYLVEKHDFVYTYQLEASRQSEQLFQTLLARAFSEI